MNRIIDNLNADQRLAILEEILADLTPDEKDLVQQHGGTLQKEDSEEYHREIGRLAAMKKNNPALSNGVEGKKLI